MNTEKKPVQASVGRKPFFKRKKSCPFAGERFEEIDYKNIRLLGRYVTEKGKIMPRRITNISQKAQRRLAREIKRSRFIALMPYVRN